MVDIALEAVVVSVAVAFVSYVTTYANNLSIARRNDRLQEKN